MLESGVVTKKTDGIWMWLQEPTNLSLRGLIKWESAGQWSPGITLVVTSSAEWFVCHLWPTSVRPRPLSMGCAAPEHQPLHCSKQFQLSELICIHSSPVPLFASTITFLFYFLSFIFHFYFIFTFYFIFNVSQTVADKLGLHAFIFAITFLGKGGAI